MLLLPNLVTCMQLFNSIVAAAICTLLVNCMGMRANFLPYAPQSWGSLDCVGARCVRSSSIKDL
jgi:hypothetical protein